MLVLILNYKVCENVNPLNLLTLLLLLWLWKYLTSLNLFLTCETGVTVFSCIVYLKNQMRCVNQMRYVKMLWTSSNCKSLKRPKPNSRCKKKSYLNFPYLTKSLFHELAATAPFPNSEVSNQESHWPWVQDIPQNCGKTHITAFYLRKL